MKIVYAIATICLVALIAQAQTQRGYVKTKGRMDAQGKVIAGTRLSNVVVTVKGRTGILSDAQGNFSFPIPANTFYISQVQKKGYELTDHDILSQSHRYSPENPFVIVMERPEDRLADKLMTERKIRRTLQQQLQKREEEIEQLKIEKKITDEEYRQQLQRLYQDQENNEALIDEMSNRYSQIDYDQIDEFNRKVNEYILNGELTRADSLLRTKGELTERISELHRHQEANVQESKDVAKSKVQLSLSVAASQKDMEDYAQDCYNYFELCKCRHNNDSAAYYIRLRASLDSTNVAWQVDAGNFLRDSLSQYDKAVEYYQQGVQQALHQENNHIHLVACYIGIAQVSQLQDDKEQALWYYEQALAILQKKYPETHPEIITLQQQIESLKPQDNL